MKKTILAVMGCLIMACGSVKAEDAAQALAAPPPPATSACVSCQHTTCCKFSCHTSCAELRHKLWEWMTYRPLQRTCCCECWFKCEPRKMPPLYAFFPRPECASKDCGNSCVTSSDHASTCHVCKKAMKDCSCKAAQVVAPSK